MAKSQKNGVGLLRTWTLPTSATLGSSVRAKGILQEAQARLPARSKKAVSLSGADIVLAMAANEKDAFHGAARIVSETLEEASTLPVIPREIQDILVITSTERRRWLADGRLPSAGTRTVRLAGRARQITFHVFDLKVVEDLLDRGAVDEWRVEDAEAKAQRREQTAYQTKLKRALKKAGSKKADKTIDNDGGENDTSLRGWEEFGRDGLLR